MLLRMLNDPCQSETGRQMARANPQYRRLSATSQEPGAAQSRAVKSDDCLGRDHTLRRPRDKGQYPRRHVAQGMPYAGWE